MKRKGFTLIELLAVIVILAIIALMVTPMISDLIESSRYASAVDSALAYVAGANSQAAPDTGIGGFEDFSLNLTEEDTLETGLTDEELAKIKYKGKGPTYVYLHFDSKSKQVSDAKFCIWGFSIDYSSETGVSKGEGYCDGGDELPDVEPPGEILCDALRNNLYDSNTTFKIKSVEDLVCMSQMSASGKTYEGKTIYLVNDIDFNEDSSYEDPNGTSLGDVNGNGTVEGLKTEVTTSKGFNPIGSSANPFKGTFEGYAKTISNLMINRSQDNVGLFGYIQGKIQGFTITSNITGNTSVGGVVGCNNGGVINEIIASATVSSYINSYDSSVNVGGIVGNLETGRVENVLVKSATIPILNSSHNIGGIVGRSGNTSNIIKGIVESGRITINGNTPTSGYYKIGKIVGLSQGIVNGYASTSMLGTASGNSGTSYVLSDEILNAYDKLLDTYIGGDNDESGYYFDYESDSSSNIVIKRTSKTPIRFTLKGSGTEASPYIIDSYKHYKEATILAGNKNDDDTYKSYKIKFTNDIDFTGKHYYALGTNGNILTSDIDGDLHTLSNISFNCAENCGLISQNSKTIEGLNLENITIVSGSSNIGGLVGTNIGTIKGINAIGMNITGYSEVGGIVGSNNGGTVNKVIASVTAGSTINSYDASVNVGGIVGNLETGRVENALVRSATLSALNSVHNIGGIVGRSGNTSNVIKGVVESGRISFNGTTPTSGYYKIGKIVGLSQGTVNGYASTSMLGTASGNSGSSYVLRDEMLNTYDKVIDTYIGGVNDDSGYYFDYESDNSNNIVLKRTKDYPITFTLAGSGTSNDPYIIDSYQHYKEATLLAGNKNDDDTYKSYKIKLTNDIDFTGKHYYSLGTNGNILTSDIDGDMHTLSNVTINCAENCGLISQNSKTIEGLNIANITIVSGNSNIGGLVGNNTGTIKGINATGINITGYSEVGGIVGSNNGGTINEVAVNVTAGSTINSYDASVNVGGIVGNLETGIVENVLVRNATLPALNSVHNIGGIVGRSGNTSNVIKGVVESGRITFKGNVPTSGYYKIGKIVGLSQGTVNGYASNNMLGTASGNSGIGYTLVPPTTVTYSNTEIDSLTYYNNVGVLDTVINGDDDNSGYYMQYNDSADSIIVVKAGSTSNSSNPSNPVNTSSPVPIIETKVGDNPPTCVLNEVIPRSAGIQAVLTCEDEEGAPTIRSQWNVNKNAVTNQFSDTGIIKEGTVSGNSKTVRPYWSTSNTISVPTPNTCYYYRFGAQDASGNWSYYVTDECYYGFSN